MAVKEFWEKHKNKIYIVTGAAALLAPSVITAYDQGKTAEVRKLCKDMRIKSYLHSLAQSDMLYSLELNKDKTMKFENLGHLAQEAIDFDESHLKDDIVAMYVLTNKGE